MSGEITMAKKEKYEDYQVRNDLDTIIQANQILDDKSKHSKLVAEVKKRQEATEIAEKQLGLEEKTSERIKKLLGNK